MPYVNVTDFKFGLDRRRPRVAGVPGTLWTAKNVHISRGGDIEAAKKWVSTYALPAGTFGLLTIGEQLFVFGSADLASSVPPPVQYQRLTITSGAAMTGVLHAVADEGAAYVIAEYADGSIHHFRDGTRIAAHDTLADATAGSNWKSLADLLARKIDANAAVSAIASGETILVTADVPGTAFTISGTATDNGASVSQGVTITTLQANVPAVAEVRAAGTVTITGGSRDPAVNTIAALTVNGTPVISAPVDWVSSNDATANALAIAIGNGTSTHGYTATAAGAVVTIRAAVGLGATANGRVVVATGAGDVTMSTANLSGGVTAVAPVAQVSQISFTGVYENVDLYEITVNGTVYAATGRASGMMTYALVSRQRVYGVAGSLLRYSQINDTIDWTDASPSSGAGFINMAGEAEGSERLVALATYQTFMAIFARSSIRVYYIEADAERNELVQVVENSGTLAPRSVVSFGNIDLFYLDDTGVRSLRARDSSNAAFVSDIGTNIDPDVQTWVRTVGDAVAQKAVAVVDPQDGRYLLAIGSRIYVLSYFPGAKINAWSYYEPGFTVTDFARTKRRLYARDASAIYLYGGLTGNAYPARGELTYTVDLPFMGAERPATWKKWLGFDIACSGEWLVEVLTDPEDETKVIQLGRVTGTTFHKLDHVLPGRAPLFAFRLTCTGGGPATISSLAMHYESEGAR